MRATKAIVTSLLATALVTVPLSSASAHWHHHYGLIGGLFGFVGDVVVGAATIVTAPIVILAHAASEPAYDAPRRAYEGRPPSYAYREYGYGPPPPAYYGRQDYPPPSGYASREDRGYGPPPGYGPDEGYDNGPSPDDYASRDARGYGYDRDEAPYYGRPRYSRDEDDRRFGGDDNEADGANGIPPRGEDRDGPSYDGPADSE